MSIDFPSLLTSIQTRLDSSVQKIESFRGETTLYITRKSFFKVCRLLKEEYGFTFLVDVTAVDYLDKRDTRYEMVYVLHRFGNDYEENFRLRLKVLLDEKELSIDSITPIWSSANWLEREVYDMFGVQFPGHPDLRRILMPDDYEPHPLRKDFDVRNREPSKQSFEKALKEGIEQ
ncbi:MAG TPA: NADH-quinone oxidoreductase subunit C [Thermodesulfobacteriota bacterium]|nr:NADH-quinone oxidoreductase subunit C [Thermodesulfobacteriota bacterium]